MAISGLMLLKVCRKIGEGAKTIASMGYPDIVADESIISKAMNGDISQLTYRDDSAAICQRHGLNHHPIPHTEKLFDILGAKLTFFDVAEIRGGEIVADLNYPISDEYNGKFDIVIDVGTLEHCFNIGQAAINMASMVKVGGHIFHENPWNWGNHGFYGINPTWYHDFYGHNGFTIEDYRLISRRGGIIQFKNTSRFAFYDDEAVSYALAKRDVDMKIGFPTQTKYKGKI